MMISHEAEGDCPKCGSEDVHYSYDEDGSITKVYGNCTGCGKDFGRIDRITSSNKVKEKAERKARKFFK
jgi:uncharacterized protein (DUF983 family)